MLNILQESRENGKMKYINMESKESLELKRQAGNDLRNSLTENGGFDTDTINQIMEAFQMIVTKYVFRRKK